MPEAGNFKKVFGPIVPLHNLGAYKLHYHYAIICRYLYRVMADSFTMKINIYTKYYKFLQGRTKHPKHKNRKPMGCLFVVPLGCHIWSV